MKEYLKEKAHQLPLTPGVYLMKDATDTIIYVGKAKKLKNRVSSYFINSNQHSRKTMRLVKQIIDFDVLHTDTELDALLLECQLIQQYRPRYNRQMNAYEQYSYVSVAVNERQLEIKLLNIPTKENCFGPYSIRRKFWIVSTISSQPTIGIKPFKKRVPFRPNYFNKNCSTFSIIKDENQSNELLNKCKKLLKNKPSKKRQNSKKIGSFWRALQTKINELVKLTNEIGNWCGYLVRKKSNTI